MARADRMSRSLRLHSDAGVRGGRIDGTHVVTVFRDVIRNAVQPIDSGL